MKKKTQKLVPVVPRAKTLAKKTAPTKDVITNELVADPLLQAIEDANKGTNQKKLGPPKPHNPNASNQAKARNTAQEVKATLNNITVSSISRLKAQLEGLLPHEMLLAICRGDPIRHKRVRNIFDDAGLVIDQIIVEEDVYVDMATRIDCAKSAAPYYAPKLAAQVVKFTNNAPWAALKDSSDEAIDAEILKLSSIVEVTSRER
jgi:hypothetical protein